MKEKVNFGQNEYEIFNISNILKNYNIDISILPFCIRILVENIARNNIENLISIVNKYKNNNDTEQSIDFFPSRILMQDFTGVPAIVDLAAMRSAMPHNPSLINPKIPIDLVIDHSIQVNKNATQDSLQYNMEIEFLHNKERYEFLQWAQKSLQNFRVIPPGIGICHQVNLEYLAQVVFKSGNLLYFDSVIGTDSHTTMINALSVLGWGVGGIEAEVAMLGEPLSMILPKVVGVQLIGRLSSGITATDLVLDITQKLRMLGVTGKFVEFYGAGLEFLSLADRATISNMAPEYGATCGFFPVTQETIDYLYISGRNNIDICEKYCKIQHLWYDHNMDCNNIQYDAKITIDLTNVQTFLAGPKRPQDKISLENVSNSFQVLMQNQYKIQDVLYDADIFDTLHHGSVVISAITSCTNTSNPYAMIAAGLLARNAVKFGLQVKPWVKTSFAPGSKVVSQYLYNAGLQNDLDKLGYNIVGYGCTTCIGNSGILSSEVEEQINTNKLIVSSVISGNRNFEGRIHPLVKANYIASPFLCIAYAIAGNININFNTQPLGIYNNKEVFLRDILPSDDEINILIKQYITRETFIQKYHNVFHGNAHWQKLNVPQSEVYPWDNNSTYIKHPPYFTKTHNEIHSSIKDIKNAKILAIFGDSITTDHISPAGNIAKNSPAAQYLMQHGVSPDEFNSYGARRGNHEVMVRGTFANVRLKNQILDKVEGGFTYFNDKIVSIFDASEKYKQDNIPLVVFAGKEYGTGSSRDWAAKGTYLLGIKAVIAESFERIHRSNLVGMGVIPLQLQQNIASLNLKGNEDIAIYWHKIEPMATIQLMINDKQYNVIAQINTKKEIEYLQNGGIMQYMLFKKT